MSAYRDETRPRDCNFLSRRDVAASRDRDVETETTSLSLRCFDTDGWVAGRTSAHKNRIPLILRCSIPEGGRSKWELADPGLAGKKRPSKGVLLEKIDVARR